MYEITDNIFYVGSHLNNAYLVKGEMTAVIGTVKKSFVNEFLTNIEDIIPISDIDYLICNHIEPDHEDAIRKIIEKNSDIKIVTTVTASRNLKEILNKEFDGYIAKEGAALSLGQGKTLQFRITPNLPWPDTMVTYIVEDKILFSGELFGSVFCEDISGLEYRENDNPDKYDFKSYFSGKFSAVKAFVKTAVSKISAVETDVILPSHGNRIIKDTDDIINKYMEWSSEYEGERKTAAIFYDSFCGYTEKMAERIQAVLLKSGIDTKRYNIHGGYDSNTIMALNSAGAIIFGTPTINQNASVNMWKLISEIDMINRKGTPCFVFGSYGWGGEGVQYIHKHLSVIKMKPFDKPFSVIFNPSEEKLSDLEEYTKRFLKSL